MSKTYTRQTHFKFATACPPNIQARLQEIKRRCREEAEANTRKQRALDRAERYETWQEVCMGSVPLKGRR